MRDFFGWIRRGLVGITLHGPILITVNLFQTRAGKTVADRVRPQPLIAANQAPSRPPVRIVLASARRDRMLPSVSIGMDPANREAAAGWAVVLDKLNKEKRT